MRILYVTADFGLPVLGNKGGSVHIRELIGAFRGLGHEVVTLSPWTGRGKDNRFTGDLREIHLPGIEEEVLDRLRNSMTGEHDQTLFKEMRSLFLNPVFLELIEEINEEKPIDFLYERLSLWNFAGAGAAERLGVPYILEVNAPLPVEQEKYRRLYLKSLSLSIEGVLFDKADAIIAVSREVKSYIVEKGVPATKIHVMSNAVDTDVFEPGTKVAMKATRKRLNIPDDHFVVGFIGSLKKWHGLEVLMDAMRDLWSHSPDYHLLIVGNGPLRSWLEGLVRRERLNQRVTLTGEIPYHTVPSVIRIMDVGVAPYLPAREFYFSPLKVVEYMATGKPVVASSLGQIRELIDHGVTGFLCEPGDSGDLARAIRTVREKPEQAGKTGSSARASVLNRGSWRKSARQIMSLVEETWLTTERDRNTPGSLIS